MPQNYTSFIAPVMCAKLHSDVNNFSDVNKHSMSSHETPYVVLMKSCYVIDKPQPLFYFNHPKLGKLGFIH